MFHTKESKALELIEKHLKCLNQVTLEGHGCGPSQPIHLLGNASFKYSRAKKKEMCWSVIMPKPYAIP